MSLSPEAKAYARDTYEGLRVIADQIVVAYTEPPPDHLDQALLALDCLQHLHYLSARQRELRRSFGHEFDEGILNQQEAYVEQMRASLYELCRVAIDQAKEK